MTAPLSPKDRDRLETLFARAADLSPTEHADFVARECGADGALRDELMRLLDGLAGADHLARLKPGTPLQAGTRIGAYKLLERIGEGGMGEVYAAEQLEPVSRRVALKVIKLGMDSAQVVARFEAERQALARMTHPNIAQVYDAGVTGDGRPYFVMELVSGVPITEYCDRRRLSTRQRLELFVEICAGVQHAHQKGIIHRDLKPSNLLITEHDGRAIVKIIDFGVARATTGRLAEHTLYTTAGQIIGTLDYMSPEQADPTALDLDTRSDVYSLGVVLYELVAGVRPFAHEKPSATSFQEILRRITDEDPPKPSTRLADSDTESAAHNRRADTRTLVRELRGDLDWIALKALEKDPARRYSSASEFAADVRRHLDDEPVLAGRPGLPYRARKFVRRNRLAVVAGAVVTVGILAALYGIFSSRAAGQLTAAQRPYADAYLLRKLEQSAKKLWPPHPDKIGDQRKWLDEARALASTLEMHRLDLEAMQRGDSSSETAAARLDTLVELVAGLRGLTDTKTGLLSENGASPEHGWSVPRRLRFAEDLRKGFATGGKYAETWKDHLRAIRAVYPALDLKPQMGLVPIGKDPDSPNYLFAHLMTGAPAKLTEGKLELTDTTGVVLVLIPGEEPFFMGAQSTDRKKPNFDPGAGVGHSPVRKIKLSPHFLSKYEMTQGQWQELTGANPSRYGPHRPWEKRWLESGAAPSLRHPVEQVSWRECQTWLARTGLTLPTEAQWEHGARAGTSTRFWTGDDHKGLQAAANISDIYARDHGGEEHQRPPKWFTYTDGSTMHAPVDSYRPNAFGLYNVHGNVYEWCLDGYRWNAYEEAQTPGEDPVVEGDGDHPRVYRGGCYRGGPGAARSATRSYYPPAMKGHALGVRPARRLDADTR